MSFKLTVTIDEDEIKVFRQNKVTFKYFHHLDWGISPPTTAMEWVREYGNQLGTSPTDDSLSREILERVYADITGVRR